MKYIIRFSIFNFFLIRLNQICPAKMYETWSNLITFDFWWDNHWNISSYFQPYIFFDQIESDLSKWIRMDQIGSKWIKTDQTWSNWISDQIIIEIYHQIFKFIYLLIKMDQICPKWIKTDQNGSNLIKFGILTNQKMLL